MKEFSGRAVIIGWVAQKMVKRLTGLNPDSVGYLYSCKLISAPFSCLKQVYGLRDTSEISVF